MPVNIAGGSITSGSNSADQTATNGATSGPAVNEADTTQENTQTQEGGSSSCVIGCGGNGQAQLNCQGALTGQYANSSAEADQNAVNANVPVNIAGGSITGGDNSADQTATNEATSDAAVNGSTTTQSGEQSQS